MERSRQWAVRCLHEASLYDDNNCFITLTYDNDHLLDNSLHVDHFQKFMKRLRKAFPDENIRYYHCGEYGEINKRPHYHALLFNFQFPDREQSFEKSKTGCPQWESETLTRIWGMGRCMIGEMNVESAQYVARYIHKKLLGATQEEIDAHYQGRAVEYTTMSRRPGIGAGWFEKWKSDVFPHDYTVVNGKEVKPPKFYTSLLEREDPDAYKQLKEKRTREIKEMVPLWERLKGRVSQIKDGDFERLQVKEKVRLSYFKSHVRDI